MTCTKSRMFAERLTQRSMLDLKALKRIYQFSKDLTLSDAQLFISAAGQTSFAKGEILIDMESKTTMIYFIRKGLVRMFTVLENGEERTMSLIPEYHLVANGDMVLFERPSRYVFQALEPTTTFYMDFEVAQQIMERNPHMEKHRKHMLRRFIVQYFTRLETFVLMSAEERYVKYVEENPDLIHRVADKYIAQVLGITPVSLSRIRKRLAQKKR